MPEQDDSIRRLNRRNRKERIESSGDLFPPDDVPSLPPLDLSFLPNNDAQDIADLTSLPSGLVSRPLTVSPTEERYPPLAPAPKRDAMPASLSVALHPPLPTAKATGVLRYNLLTVLCLLGSLVMCAVYSAVWIDPYSPLNPAPPEAVYVIVTATPEAFVIVPPTANPETDTLAKFPYQLISTGVLYLANANGRDCEWASVGGSVTEANGTALNGYRITITGDDLTNTVFTGGALTFGEGGYEFPLGGAPQAKELSVQLFSPQGAPLSDPVSVTTRATCEENVVLVSFIGR